MSSLSEPTSDLLMRIVDRYRSSPDFNGMPVHWLGTHTQEIADTICELISMRFIDLVRGDEHADRHIKAIPADSATEQIEKIANDGLGNGCLYPSPEHLATLIAPKESLDAPFTRELILGAAQLDFRSFDLRVLEWYRNDPRYSYNVDDIHGLIHRQAENNASTGPTLDDLDFLEFGFSYNSDDLRAIAVFLRCLHDLSPDQQAHLKSYQLDGDFKLHPDFVRTQILGKFPERISIYDAFLQEKHHINRMCERMDRTPLFRTENKAYERPAGFGILIRPTKKEFRDFALLLDQLLSDDLNRKFFEPDIRLNETLTRSDGTTFEHQVGTITLLETWIGQEFRPAEDDNGIEELFKDMRRIRRTRQRPAHQVEDNDFDQKYVIEQRQIMDAAFNVVRMIRMILENYPNVVGYEVEDWLRDPKIWKL